jgi:hypothetical protein
LPAFSFEKISSAPRIEPAPAPVVKRRGRLARLVDRLAAMRLQAYEVRNRRLGARRRPKPDAPTP